MERQRQNRRYSIRKARISMKLAVPVRRPGSCANPSRRFPALAGGKANPKVSTSCVYLRRFAFTSANGIKWEKLVCHLRSRRASSIGKSNRLRDLLPAEPEEHSADQHQESRRRFRNGTTRIGCRGAN